jgi:hypothetical protein
MATANNGDFECRQDRVVSGQSVALRTNTDGIKNAPNNGSGVFSGTAPHLTMSPVTPTGLPTMGAQLSISLQLGGIKSPAVPVATGFIVTVWVRNPITYTWRKMSPMTFATAGASDTDVFFVTEDLDASEIYFQVAAASVSVDGFIDFTLVEI